MEKIIEKEFWDIYYNKKLNIMEFYWKDTGNYMKPDEFKQYLLESVRLLKNYQVEALLVNGSQYHVVIPPKVQEWHDNVIIPAYLEANIQVMVFVLNSDNLIESLSLEQTFSEQKASAIPTHFVDSIKKAREILMNTLKVNLNSN